MTKKRMLWPVFVLTFFMFLSTVYAMPILSGSSSDGYEWTATDSDGRSASAVFTLIDDTTLSILLTNNATITHTPNEVLAGLFFGFSDESTVTPPHVEVATDSVVSGSINMSAGANMDGEWAFRSGIDGINGGLGDFGISSTAFDPESGASAEWDGFGVPYIIDSTESFAPPSVGGAEFGLVGGDVSSLVPSVNPYVKNAVLITFGFSEGSTDLLALHLDQVNFLYGTSYEGAPVPEPATMLLLGTGLIGLAGLRKKFRKN